MLTLDYHVLDEQGEIIASFKYPADREGFEGYLQEAHDDFNYSTKNDWYPQVSYYVTSKTTALCLPVPQKL